MTINTTPPRAFPDFPSFAANNPWIGTPIGDLQNVPDGVLQEYQNASVYGQYGAAHEVYEVHGAIREKYTQLGGPAGFLGLPVTDETGTPDGIGRYNHFHGGSIYWHPKIGAFEVHGLIRDKWEALGWERYGYPTTDQSATPDQVGRYNHFRSCGANGSTADASIYWTPQTGANELHGPIRETWAAFGWEAGWLGYPVSDEHDDGGNRRSDFQNGSLTWSGAGAVHPMPLWVAIQDKHITFGDGAAIGGFASFTIFSDGTRRFKGHMHNSTRVVNYDVSASCAIKDAGNHVYTAYLHKDGVSYGHDWNWDEWGHDPQIVTNWGRIRDGVAKWSDYHESGNIDPILDVLNQIWNGITGSSSGEPIPGCPDPQEDGGCYGNGGPPPDDTEIWGDDQG
jgi:hypothetical protein